MNLLELLKTTFALAVVLGLILGLAYVLRRYAPGLMANLQAQRGQKRLTVVETLVLDPARRLVLVRFDNEERLILLGEGQELKEPRLVTSMSNYSPKTSPAATPGTDPNDDLF